MKPSIIKRWEEQEEVRRKKLSKMNRNGKKKRDQTIALRKLHGKDN